MCPKDCGIRRSHRRWSRASISVTVLHTTVLCCMCCRHRRLLHPVTLCIVIRVLHMHMPRRWAPKMWSISWPVDTLRCLVISWIDSTRVMRLHLITLVESIHDITRHLSVSTGHDIDHIFGAHRRGICMCKTRITIHNVTGCNNLRCRQHIQQSTVVCKTVTEIDARLHLCLLYTSDAAD